MHDTFVTATEANRQFSKLLGAVQDGGRVTITKDGRPVAVLVPFADERRRVARAALERFERLSEQGMAIGYTGALDRDELHAR